MPWARVRTSGRVCKMAVSGNSRVSALLDGDKDADIVVGNAIAMILHSQLYIQQAELPVMLTYVSQVKH